MLIDFNDKLPLSSGTGTRGNQRIHESFAGSFARNCNCSPETWMEVTTITQADSGRIYEVVFVGKPGVLSPGQILLLVEDIDPPPEDDERSIRTQGIPGWIIAGVGGEWTLEALESTGYLYRVPFARRPVK